MYAITLCIYSSCRRRLRHSLDKRIKEKEPTAQIHQRINWIDFLFCRFFLLLRRARFIWFTSPLWTVFGTRECLLIPIKNKIKRNEGFILAMPLQWERKRRIQFWFPHSFSDSVLNIRFLKIQALSAVYESTQEIISQTKKGMHENKFQRRTLFSRYLFLKFISIIVFILKIRFNRYIIPTNGYGKEAILCSTVVINLSIYQYMHWLISRKPNRNVDDFILHTECDKQIENACLIYIL